MASTTASTPVSKSPIQLKRDPTSPSSVMLAGGFTSGCSPLSKVVMKRPHESVQDQYFIDTNWQKEGWHAAPEFNALADDQFRLMKKLQQHNVSTRCQGGDWVVALNSMLVRDTCLVTPMGKVIELPQKTANRVGDSEEGVNYLDQMGLSRVGGIDPDYSVRGSDVVFITKDLVVIAETSATDHEGIEQLSGFLKAENPETTIIVADIRSGVGAAKSRGFEKMTDRLCCALSVINPNVVVACKDIIGGPCCHALEQLSIEVVPVSLADWDEGCADILTISPKKCLMRRITVPGSVEEVGPSVYKDDELDGNEVADLTPCEKVEESEDDVPSTEPSYSLKTLLKNDYGVRTYYIYFNEIPKSGCGINPFLQPYKRD